MVGWLVWRRRRLEEVWYVKTQFKVAALGLGLAGATLFLAPKHSYG